jgi:hypothetical protein
VPGRNRGHFPNANQTVVQTGRTLTTEYLSPITRWSLCSVSIWPRRSSRNPGAITPTSCKSKERSNDSPRTIVYICLPCVAPSVIFRLCLAQVKASSSNSNADIVDGEMGHILSTITAPRRRIQIGYRSSPHWRCGTTFSLSQLTSHTYSSSRETTFLILSSDAAQPLTRNGSHGEESRNYWRTTSSVIGVTSKGRRLWRMLEGFSMTVQSVAGRVLGKSVGQTQRWSSRCQITDLWERMRMALALADLEMSPVETKAAWRVMAIDGRSGCGRRVKKSGFEGDVKACKEHFPTLMESWTLC